ncbi:MAG: anthranilate phosphoribosyltransferase, partial [Candidatus Omnitrophota bacterium]
MIREAIDKVTRRIDLNNDEMTVVFEEVMTGIATPSQIAAFVTALRMKGETVVEITAAAKVMRAKAATIDIGDRYDIVDT